MIGVEKYVEIKTNGVDSIEEQPVPTRDPVVQTLNVTPLKTAQTFNAPSGVDGFNPVNVSAVTSSIDSNITAGNIKDGVTILGVQGNYTGAGATIESLSITPTTSEQTITASGVDGYSPITVSAVTSSIDANITAENIKSGVTILGVTGTAKTAPTYYIEKTLDENDKLVNSGYVLNLSGVKDIGQNVFYGQYISTIIEPAVISFDDLTTISGSQACYSMFSNSSISRVSFPKLTTISGYLCCGQMFYGCLSLFSVDLSKLETVSGSNAMYQMFYGCRYIEGTLNLGSLVSISRQGSCQETFRGTKITGVNISSLTTVSGANACHLMFYECPITNVVFSSLETLTGSECFKGMFYGCNLLTELSFPALTSTSFGSYSNQFVNMLQNVTGCTVHFPSNLQSVIGSWTDVQNGFGGTNTTVLFDLTATE